MANPQEVVEKINAKIAELQERIESIGGTNVTGTTGKNFLVGNRFRDSSIVGLGGDDRIFGGFGDDLLLGGNTGAFSIDSGDDLIDGGNGNDTIYGGDGDDLLFGKFGIDEIYGETGDDLVDGGVGDDFLDGGEGNDQLIGGPGSDQIFGGSGSDTLTGVGNLTGDIEVDFLVGGGDLFSGSTAPDGASDLFVLGDADGSFYTNSGAENSGGLFDSGDFAVILDFEKDIDKVQLGAGITPEILIGADFLGLGVDFSTYILDNGDLIGVAPGVALANTDFISA